MALQAPGQAISLSQIQTEFGGDIPISLSEYYRNGLYVTANNGNVSSTPGATISLSNFYGAVKAITVTYQLIGAGGAGGHGNWNSYASTRAPSGGSSSITGAAITNITAAGGLGGLDASLSPSSTYAGSGTGTVYGAGGAGANNYNSETVSPGGAAPAGSYGAGGGGGGGDRPGTYDSSGGAGGGGEAGTYLTGTWLLIPGTQLSISIGSRGLDDGNGQSPGGAGANGFARFSKNGGAWTNFTSNGTYTV